MFVLILGSLMKYFQSGLNQWHRKSRLVEWQFQSLHLIEKSVNLSCMKEKEQ